MEIAVFQEHRFAFFYWLLWLKEKEIATPPALVTLDWHQDLCYPCSYQKEWLSSLNKASDGDVAEFAWSKLGGNNDDHILSAAYLDVIGDIYVHCRQEPFSGAWKDEELEDINGKVHLIKKFQTIEAMEKYLLQIDAPNVFFDVDLDFFTLKNHSTDGGERFTYMPEEEVKTILHPERPLIQWILKRIRGFTIATEPKHCGGILKSNEYLKILNDLYFEGELFSEVCKWKVSNPIHP